MAVAIVINAVRRRVQEANVEEETEDVLDDNADGHITTKELLHHFDQVVLDANKMQEVLRLELSLVEMVCKLPSFCVCLLCFMIGLVEFSPAGSTYNVHRHLQSHFNLDKLPEITHFHALYDFMEEFETRNEELQATSYKYWCEGRYSVHRWSEDYLIPLHSCPSPRLYALGLLTDSEFRWSPTASNSSGSGSGSGHTRLLAGSGSGAGSGGLRPAPPCVDDDEHLRTVTGDPLASCPTYAVDPHHLVCEHDMGLLNCRMTCGFCAPFEYHHMRRFEKPQVTMLPVMVYQTRFVKAPCHGFAETYENQPYNPVLSLMPALDGPRTAETLTCIDRSMHQESDYALELDCTPDTPASTCIDGKVPLTLKHTFHGTTIYPKLLIEPHRDMIRMKEVEWVDIQTDVLSLSTMIYTEGIEIFTSFTVNFVLDEAGNIDGSYTMISYRDLTRSSKALFLGCMITCIVVAFFTTACSCYYLIFRPADVKRGSALYELLSRILFFIYPMILLIQWSQQIPMAVEFDHLLHAFLDLPGLDEHMLEVGIQKYFDTKSIIYDETSWLFRHRIVAYLVCYIQILQLVFYFNAHPKMAVLTATVSRALDNIFHFMAVFGILYVMLAFMGHWMLGPYIKEFGTFSETFASQVQMIFGEFIKAGGVDTLDASMLAMYWIYSGTFMLLVIWTLMNFFLAIIVDSFVEVKEANMKSVAARDFFSDVPSALRSSCMLMKKGWPSRKALIDFLQEPFEDDARTSRVSRTASRTSSVDEPSYVTPSRIQEVFDFGGKYGTAKFILHYYRRCPAILVSANQASGSVERALKKKPPPANSEPAILVPTAPEATNREPTLAEDEGDLRFGGGNLAHT